MQVNKLLAMSADTHLTTEDREKAMADAQKLMKSQAAGKEKPKSRAYYRVHATHSLTGSPVQSKDRAAIKAEAVAAEAVARNNMKISSSPRAPSKGSSRASQTSHPPSRSCSSRSLALPYPKTSAPPRSRSCAAAPS